MIIVNSAFWSSSRSSCADLVVLLFSHGAAVNASNVKVRAKPMVL